MHCCVVCGDEEAEAAPLRASPCGEHYMCDSCLEDTFRLAMNDEKHYPPRCCNNEQSIFLIDDFEENLPLQLIFDYKSKEMGEYSVQPRFRTYCANGSCATFLHPETHVTNTITYAICEICSTITCITCKTRVPQDLRSHECDVPDEEKKFKITVKEKGYQECYTCGRTVELVEACNHISCECGAEFCYICGKEWEGLHACPHYGPPVYDEDGYNQDGFHKDTGLNRNGQTRREQLREDDPESEDSEEEEEEEEEGDPMFQMMRQAGMSAEEAREALDLQRFQDLQDQSVEEDPDEEGEAAAEAEEANGGFGGGFAGPREADIDVPGDQAEDDEGKHDDEIPPPELSPEDVMTVWPDNELPSNPNNISDDELPANPEGAADHVNLSSGIAPDASRASRLDQLPFRNSHSVEPENGTGSPADYQDTYVIPGSFPSSNAEEYANDRADENIGEPMQDVVDYSSDSDDDGDKRYSEEEYYNHFVGQL
ncbi:hypothetical protein K469DRAFT_750426 [Zopfia rhizophila CBS 207.26]|uniref:RBR-type E3 ubiquitin transferase n=1 Tax=Zopfia rhizophila CBS 207.26 TaxID=1314779 RepID=A0A6A6E5V4_9PEZI|nr:hypothetical protein K469DRAFT_750426 [Zopfia rhizophila CBS 207.26]